MLTKLFGSNTRVLLLKLFLVDQDKKYYIRQLSRDLGLHLNSVRRELNNLEEFGLLVSELKIAQGEELDDDSEDNKKKNKILANLKQERKYYKINISFPLVDEIRSLIMKSYVLRQKDFIDKLKTIGKIKILILTGMFTNEKRTVIDIFIVGDIDKDKLVKTIKNFEKEIGKEINYTTLNLKEFHYRRTLKDVFLDDILDSKKIVVIDTDNIVNN